MEHMQIRRAGERDREQIMERILDGFYDQFALLTQDRHAISRVLEPGIRTDRFFVAAQGEIVCGIAACSDKDGRAVYSDASRCKRQLGRLKGWLANRILRAEFEQTLLLPPDTGWIEFVAVSGEYRRQGVATLLLQGLVEQTDYVNYQLDVTDENKAALACYRKLGFQIIERVKEPHGKRKGFQERIVMEYRK